MRDSWIDLEGRGGWKSSFGIEALVTYGPTGEDLRMRWRRRLWCRPMRDDFGGQRMPAHGCGPTGVWAGWDSIRWQRLVGPSVGRLGSTAVRCSRDGWAAGVAALMGSHWRGEFVGTGSSTGEWEEDGGKREATIFLKCYRLSNWFGPWIHEIDSPQLLGHSLSFQELCHGIYQKFIIITLLKVKNHEYRKRTPLCWKHYSSPRIEYPMWFADSPILFFPSNFIQHEEVTHPHAWISLHKSMVPSKLR